MACGRTCLRRSHRREHPELLQPGGCLLLTEISRAHLLVLVSERVNVVVDEEIGSPNHRSVVAKVKAAHPNRSPPREATKPSVRRKLYLYLPIIKYNILILDQVLFHARLRDQVTLVFPKNYEILFACYFLWALVSSALHFC